MKNFIPSIQLKLDIVKKVDCNIDYNIYPIIIFYDDIYLLYAYKYGFLNANSDEYYLSNIEYIIIGTAVKHKLNN